MNDLAMETLARRLDQLERQNCLMKRAGALALAVIAAVGLMGQATGGKVAKVVEAEKFVVKDRDGKIRAELGLSGGVFAEGRMILKPDVPHLSFYDEHSKPHIRLAFDRSTAEFLLGNKERGHASIRVYEQGFASLDLNAMGKRKHSISMAAFLLGTRLSLSTAGQARVQMWGTEEARVTVYDELGSYADSGQIDTEETKTGIVKKRPASSLVLFNKENKVIWSAP